MKFALDIVLAATFPTAIYWGRDFRLLYNDAWAPILADRHPGALGRPGAEVWADIWSMIGPQMDDVVATGRGFAVFDQLLPMERGGRPHETWWNYSFTPVRDADGNVVGILNQGNETTQIVLAKRERAAEVARLHDFFQQAPVGIALLEGAGHVFEIANPAYLELVGNREVLGKTVADAVPELIEQGFLDLLDHVYRTGEVFRATGTPVELHRGGGAETRILDFVYQPIRDANGATTHIFVAVTDVTERSLAESALRASEERLQLALDSSVGVGTWFWDVPANRVTADARFLKLYGVENVSPGEGAPIEAFLRNVHPDDLARLQAKIDESLAHGTPFADEYRLIQLDGSVRWVTAQGQARLGADGKAAHFPGVSFDITERKLAEDAAREAAEELRAATEARAFLHDLAERQRVLADPDEIMRISAAALGERLELDRVGFYRVYEDHLEFGPCWTSGRLPPLDGAMENGAIGPNVVAYREGRTVVMNDLAIERPGTTASRIAPSGVGVPLLRGGQWVAVLYANSAEPHCWSGEEVAFIEAVAEGAWDAVERARAVMALRESEEKFRAIANSIDQMVWSARPDGYHDYYNARWYEYTGVPAGSTDGEGWNGMFHPDDQARAWTQWNHCLESGELYRIEYRLRHHSGQYRWVLGSAQPVRDESGSITRWFGTCTDIQDIVDAREVLSRSREELEEAIRQRSQQLMATEEQLRQAQKMEAVGQLTGGIAHDFNNMLAVVIGALDLLERRLAQGNADVERYLIAARDGATRAAALTQRLLAFSRQQPLAPVPVDANQMVHGMIELLMRAIGENITVETQLPDGIRAALADPNQLENVILNLAVNARDAMPGGGKLLIATANRRVDAETAQHTEIAPGDYVEIAVTDTGSGMAPDVAARAFDPFFTTKGVGKGTGLGLSQVFGFVRQSGGAVTIETAPGSGTTVRVTLPAFEGTPPAGAISSEPSELPRAREGETVLVVEDEDRVRSYSAEALRELGYTVIDARDGREALRMIERGQRVSLLFTDVVMPEMSGRELAKRATALLPGLKVLLTSGYAPEPEDEADKIILAKPFDLARLATRVRAALDA